MRSLDEAVEISNRFAPEHLSIPDDRAARAGPARRQRLRRAVQPRSRGRLRLRPESRAAHQRRGAHARRAVGRRLREGDLGAGLSPPRWRGWRPPSPRWRAPKDWKRTRARWRCEPVARDEPPSFPKAPSSRARPCCAMAPYSPPTGGPRRQAAPRFQREHRGLLAARDRRLCAQRSTPAAWPSIPNTARPKQAVAAYFRVAPGAVPVHQRHRRSHPGLHQHLRRRRRRRCCCCSPPTPCTASTPRWPARRSARSITRSPAWSSRCEAVAGRHHAGDARRADRQSQQSRPAPASRCWASSASCTARARPWCWSTRRITNSPASPR